jgi:transcriptional regulator with XRE-family HTH domain
MKNYISINTIYLRKVNYLTQPEFAKVAKVNRDFVSALENGKKKLFEIDFFQNVCNHFKISLDDFVNKDLSKEKPKSDFVEEPAEYYIKDRKTEDMYGKIIKSYEDQLAIKNELITEKDKRLEANNKLLEHMEKEIERTNILFNQNDIDLENSLVHKIATLIKINAAIEAVQQKQKLKNNENT